MKPEQQLLQAKTSEITFVSRQQFDKNVPAATNMFAIIEVLLKKVFSTRCVQRVIRNTIGAIESVLYVSL
jgi:hypothetical protein